LLRGARRRDCSFEGRDHGGSQSLSRLHQHVHHAAFAVWAAQLDGATRRSAREHPPSRERRRPPTGTMPATGQQRSRCRCRGSAAPAADRSKPSSIAAYSLAAPISPASINRERSVEMLMSPNSLTLTTFTARSGTCTGTTGSRARSHPQKKRPNDLVWRQISNGALRQPYLRK